MNINWTNSNGIPNGNSVEREKIEAIQAGEQALVSLRNAQKELMKARSWGYVDMFGGGFFSTMFKHNKMGNAQKFMDQAKWDLQRFSKELRDVTYVCNLNVNVDGFLSFADYFFDGFFADMMVQSKINEARRQVDNAIYQVENILNQLRF